ncbi:DUF4942 domain-containing protein [Pseudocitrobacter cyperus]|uniref:DUF4942 domain-containing protein n=1 Tax=Pseudocitrobacter cyperus TaxID=3112843 RepID=UPI00398C5C3A
MSASNTVAVYEDEYLSIRYFQNGSGHITFKRLDLTKTMNNIIAKTLSGDAGRERMLIFVDVNHLHQPLHRKELLV